MNSARIGYGSGLALPLGSFLQEIFFQLVLLILLFVGFPLSIWLLSPKAWFAGLSILLSLWMMHRLVGVFNVRCLTLPAFFYFMYFGIILVPGFFIFREEATPARDRFLFSIVSVLLTVPFGIWLANLLSHFRMNEIAEYFRRPVQAKSSATPNKRLFVIVLAISIGFVLLNLWETPVVPLLYLIRHPGDSLEVAFLREDAFKLLTSNFTYIYYVVRMTMLPFLTLVAFGRYLRDRQLAWKRLFFISLSAAVFYASLTIEKSPVAAIAGIIGIFYYLFRGGKLGKTATIVIPALFLLFPVIVILLAFSGTEGGTLGAALQAMATRIFYSPADVLYYYFEVFPGVIPFLHGASLPKLAFLLGQKAIDIPNVVGLYMTDGIGIGSVSANACFIGNANADFGLPGVIAEGVLAGFVMQLVSVYFYRKPKTVVNLSASAICYWAFGILVASALTTQMLSGGVTFAFLLGWLFRERQRAFPANA